MTPTPRSTDPERGAALLLAIAVIVVVGLIMASLFPLITTSLHDRTVLDSIRDREYAADGAIEFAVARVRGIGGAGPALAPCGGPDARSANGVTIRVDCANVPTLTTRGYLQRNVIFSACVDTSPSVACTDASAVVRVQVNYETPSSGPSPAITRTYVQSWSVNR